MILTNKQNLPQQIVTAIMRDPYSRGKADISVTQLIQPPRIIQLKARHEQEIEEDASDRIWSLLGQTCHSILERSDDTGAFHEERISVEIEGWTISGASDCYVTKQFILEKGEYESIPPTIRDYKFVKTMAADFPHPDWEQQANLLAYLWQDKGFPVSKLEIVTIYRDWSKVLHERGNYPPAAQVHKQKLWTLEQQEQFIRQRVILHRKASEVGDNYLPLCTPEDQWRKAPKWAVMHPKKAKAVRLLDTFDKAEAYIRDVLKQEKTHYIEHRPAQAMRCNMFCDVAPFCDQFKAEKAAAEKDVQAKAA
jgi:hypothetical protein